MAEPLPVYHWQLAAGSDTARELIARCRDRLPREERARCYRLQQTTDRDMALLSRVMVRTMLAMCQGGDPGTLELGISAGGKPVVAPKPRTGGAPGHHFSLSHSRGQVLLALSTKPIGVDLEHHDGTRNIRALARRYYSMAEAAHLDQLPRGETVTAFYRLWVLKEACCKAIGLPLATGLERFQFTPAADGGFHLVDGAQTRAREWQFSVLEGESDWSAAIACGCHSGALAVTAHAMPLTQALSLWGCR